MPDRPNSKQFPKDDFVIDLVAGSCTCRAGRATRQLVPMTTRSDLTGCTYKPEGFHFDGAVCGTCPLRPQCTSARSGVGRTVRLHPREALLQEALLQEARAFQQSPAYDEYRRRRVVAEHRLARLVQLGIRQARYFGRAKTNYQLYLATTVANISLLTDKISLTGDSDPEYPDFINVADAGANYSGHLPRNPRWALASLVTAWLLVTTTPKRAFRRNS